VNAGTADWRERALTILDSLDDDEVLDRIGAVRSTPSDD